MHRVAGGSGAMALVFGAALVSSPAFSQSLMTPSYTEAQAKAGEKAYMENCSGCHGDKLDNGMGDGAPALVGPAFVAAWGKRPLDELYSFTRSTMPLSAPRSLSSATYVRIMAFLLSKNGVPAGVNALPSDIAALKKLSGPH
jgi:mono/diheme cytochrome c family protein